MPFLSVSFTNFRNIGNDTLDLLANEIFFVGENGQGKTNILESLYISAYGGSFRTRNDSELATTGTDSYSIRVLFRDCSERTHTISILHRDGKKRIEKNTKHISDRKELVDTIPCVLFCHDDLDFAAGNPERKRFFIDQSLSMYETSYIDILRRYKKILKTRNTIIREQKYDMLDVLDAQLVEAGIPVIEQRRKTILEFNQIFARLYHEVSGIDGVNLEYSPSWKKESLSDIMIHLVERRKLDISLGTSTSGPHRDRIRFVRRGKKFVPTASTGQRRLLSLLLRNAQARFYTEKNGKKPVLLMDDVMLELDPDKRQRFTALLPEYDQLLCTFLPGEPYERYQRSSTMIYHIQGGNWNG